MGYLNSVLRSQGRLSIAERELIATYVSGLNACTFCFGSHAIYAQAFGIDPAVIDAMLTDLPTAPVADKLKPILAYVAKLNRLPSKLVAADAQAVWDAGWDEQALFEAVEVTALFNLMNRIVEGSGVNFDYADNQAQHNLQSGDSDALSESYLNYGRKIAALVASKT